MKCKTIAIRYNKIITPTKDRKIAKKIVYEHKMMVMEINCKT